MFPPLAKYAGLYQELLKGFVSHERLGNRLTRLGEQAHAFRQFDKVKEIGRLLSHIPIKSYQAIGYYFLAVAANNVGNGDQEQARRLLELTVETAPTQYKSKALLSLAAVSINTGAFDSGFYYYNEAINATGLNAGSIEALKGVAVLKAIEGYHSHAIKGLENMLPLIKYAEPRLYFDYLNSYAVELGEAGRLQEARNVSRLVLASPFIHAYPEWQETARDLKEPSHSFVTVPSIKREAETIETQHASEPSQPARVISFPELKEAPQPKKPDRLTPQEHARLTESDKRELILAAIRSGAITGDDYDKLMGMVGLLTLGPADKVLDLEDEEILDDIAVIWSAAIGNEEFAGFLSALRDCDDSLRQKNILDRLITKIFHETQLCSLTEEEWRLRVERRLPD